MSFRNTKKAKKKSRVTFRKGQKCPECPLTFLSQSRFRYHSLTHLSMKDRPMFTCTICSKKYTTKGILESHIKQSHTRDVVYQCKECPKSFHLKDSFQKHILYLHTPEKAHSCKECGKEFAVKGSLTTHVYRIHSSIMRHSCSLCSSKFKSLVILYALTTYLIIKKSVPL